MVMGQLLDYKGIIKMNYKELSNSELVDINNKTYLALVSELGSSEVDLLSELLETERELTLREGL